MLESLMTAIANLYSASPGPEAPMDVAFEGWLTKHQKIIGSWRGRIGSNWRKRYFKLEGGFLYYSTGPKDNRFKGAICINGASLVDASEEACRKHCFAIETCDGTSWLLDCASGAEMYNWMNAIRTMTSQLAGEEQEIHKDAEQKLLKTMSKMGRTTTIEPLTEDELQRVRKQVEILKTGSDSTKRRAVLSLCSMSDKNEAVVGSLVEMGATSILIREALSSDRSIRKQAAIVVASIAISEAKQSNKIPAEILRAIPALMHLADDEVQMRLHETLTKWGYEEWSIMPTAEYEALRCTSERSVDSEHQAAMRSESIDNQLLAAAQEEAEMIKLLLLGAGESGKSTIFKQMKILHLQGYNREERLEWLTIVQQNLHGAIYNLIEAANNSSSIGWQSEAAKQAAEELLDFDPTQNDEFTQKVFEQIALVWAEPAVVQLAADDNNLSSTSSSASSAFYFLNAVGRIGAEDYEPTVDDVLRARVVTCGITHCEFVMRDYKFHMTDVGGQRTQRKKWIHCFDDVTAILFVAALSEFDQTLHGMKT